MTLEIYDGVSGKKLGIYGAKESVMSSATVYAPGARPANFSDHIWLYTAGDPVATVVDGAPVGPKGRLFEIPTDKAVRVPWEAGRFILDHLGYTGVVRVNESNRVDEDGNVTGTELDLAAAKEESLAKFEEADRKRWADYVQYVIDDKINNKKVVPPPPDPIKAIMQRRGYKLSDFGVDAPGQKESPSSDAEVASLKTENATLRQQLTEQGAKLDKLLKALDMDSK